MIKNTTLINKRFKIILKNVKTQTIQPFQPHRYQKENPIKIPRITSLLNGNTKHRSLKIEKNLPKNMRR